MNPLLADSTTFTIPLGLAALAFLTGIVLCFLGKVAPAVFFIGFGGLLLCWPR